MPLLSEILVAVLILVGSFFLLVGSYGLARLPDLMTRLHGPSKASTLGVGCLLLASMLQPLLDGRLPSAHELLITLFLVLTTPVSAHMLAKAHLHRDRRTAAGLPPAANGGGWATLDDDPPPPRDA